MTAIDSEEVVPNGPVTLTATFRQDGKNPGAIRIVLPDGQSLIIPQGLLQTQPDGTFNICLNAQELDENANDLREPVASASPSQGMTIPLVAEHLEMQKQWVDTAKVRVSKTTETHEQIINVPLNKTEVSVERVPVGRYVTETPSVRHVGNVTIIPIVEEVLVIEKRLLLNEELRLTTTHAVSQEQRSVTLRKEVVSVERIPISTTAS